MDTEENKNDTCSVTNTSSIPFMVLSSSNKTKQKALTIYESTLTILPTVDRKTVVANQETAKINLSADYYMRNGKKEPLLIYILLFVHPGTFFPISSEAEELSEDDLYEPITIAKQDMERMDLTARFYKYVPVTSKLYRDFTKVLTGVKTIDGHEVDDFFKNTDSYKTVNFNSIMLVSSYIKSYPAIWADYKEKYTYYLYSSPSAKGKPNLEGTLELTLNKELSSTSIDLKKIYTIVFKNTKGNITPVEYSQGVFSSTDEQIDIHLSPYFDKKGAITKKAEDSETIVLLAGKINGVDVLGKAEKYDTDNIKPEDQSLDAFLHPHTFQQKMSLAMEIIGILFGVHFALSLTYGLIKFIKNQRKPKPGLEPETKEELNERFKNFENDLKARIKKTGASFSEPRELSISLKNARLEELCISKYMRGNVQVTEIRARIERVKKVAENFGVDQEIEEIASDLRTSLRKAKKSLSQMEEARTPEQKISAMEGLDTSLSENKRSLESEDVKFKQDVQEKLQDLTEQTSREFKVASENAELLKVTEEKMKTKEEELSEGKGGEEPGEGDFGKMDEFDLKIPALELTNPKKPS